MLDLSAHSEYVAPGVARRGEELELARHRAARQAVHRDHKLYSSTNGGAPQLERAVAIEILSDQLGEPVEEDCAIDLRANAGTAEQLFVEARALAQIADPNVLAVHELGTDRGRAFLVMELGAVARSLRDPHTGDQVVSRSKAIPDLGACLETTEAQIPSGPIQIGERDGAGAARRTSPRPWRSRSRRSGRSG